MSTEPETEEAPTVPWIEKYRPSNFDAIVMDPLNRELFRNCLDRNYIPNLLFYGPPGTGKTTTIINFINEYQDRYHRRNKSTVIHLNASDERGIDIIRNQIHQFVKSNNLFESGIKFVILDEVDYMTKNAQQALKYILQTSNYNVRFCLICNYITKIVEALKNEFVCIRFNQLPQALITRFIQDIAQSEQLTVSDDEIAVIQNMYNSDIRSMINHLQLYQHVYSSHDRTGPTTSSILHCQQLDALHRAIAGHDVPRLFHDLSVAYNLDKKAILIKYINHCTRTYPVTSERLDHYEALLHQEDVPIDVLLRNLTVQ
jgi:replication factor C subunit 3/5